MKSVPSVSLPEPAFREARKSFNVVADAAGAIITTLGKSANRVTGMTSMS